MGTYNDVDAFVPGRGGYCIPEVRDMSKTYTPDELAELLTFGNAYVKMVLKRTEGYEPGKPVTEEVAARVAAKVNRPWPPEQAQKSA